MKRPIATPHSSPDPEGRVGGDSPPVLVRPEDSDITATPQPVSSWRVGFSILAMITVSSILLRFLGLGRLSFWHDEADSMRLARAANPSEMIRLLGKIDATRAPLHPLLLWCWVHLFGSSEFAGRAFSAVCGVATVLVVFAIGKRLFGAEVGRIAALLTALSPLMIEYSQEARMYALLALLTAVNWLILIGFRRGITAGKLVSYSIVMASLAYSHPLGIFMGLTLGIAAWLDRKRSGLTPWQWLATHLGAAVLVLPWVGRYLDHKPEFLSGTLPIRFLIGLPIGFTGGGRLGLLLTASVIAWGIFRGRKTTLGSSIMLLVWLVVPPVTLYVYSRLSHPIFGPSRYNLFVGPAYLLLLAAGLKELPPRSRFLTCAVLVVTMLGVAIPQLRRTDTKADWKNAAVFLDQTYPRVPLVVVSDTPERNVEVETTAYYVHDRPIVAMPRDWREVRSRYEEGTLCVSLPTRDGKPVAAIPPCVTDPGEKPVATADFHGLRIYVLRSKR